MGLGAGAGATGAASALGPWGLGALIGSQIAGPVISAMFAPEGQELNSFEGTDVDPREILSGTHGMLGEFGRALSNRALTPVSLPSSYVQQPGAYAGGTLPFPIGVVASDPALGNPSLLNLPGLGEFESLANIFRDMSSAGGGAAVPRGGGARPPTGGYTPDGAFDFPDMVGGDSAPASPVAEPSMDGARTAGPTRRGFTTDAPGSLVRGEDLLAADDMGGGPGDDLDQGVGAVMMMLESLKGMQTAGARV